MSPRFILPRRRQSFQPRTSRRTTTQEYTSTIAVKARDVVQPVSGQGTQAPYPGYTSRTSR